MTTPRTAARAASLALVAWLGTACQTTQSDSGEDHDDDDTADEDESSSTAEPSPPEPSEPDGVPSPAEDSGGADDDDDDDDEPGTIDADDSGGADDSTGGDVDAPDCDHDAYEPNDDVDSAWPLSGPAHVVSVVCDQGGLFDSDWYALGRWTGASEIRLSTMQAVGPELPDVRMTMRCGHQVVGYAVGHEKDEIIFAGTEGCNVGTELWLEVGTDAATPTLGSRYVLVRD